MSPRQVISLIQRVGRSGHRLDRESEGIIISVFPDDTLESLASIKNAKNNLIEPVPMHEGALDVLSHQIAGLLMDQTTTSFDELVRLIHRSYLYRKLAKNELLDLIHFLDSLNHLRFDEVDCILTKTAEPANTTLATFP